MAFGLQTSCEVSIFSNPERKHASIVNCEARPWSGCLSDGAFVKTISGLYNLIFLINSFL